MIVSGAVHEKVGVVAVDPPTSPVRPPAPAASMPALIRAIVIAASSAAQSSSSATATGIQPRCITRACTRRSRMAETCGSDTTASEIPSVITYICRPMEPY